ncbi:MAG: CRISPR-associated endonuclease Cas2 [Patescibacteria group bacterium]
MGKLEFEAKKRFQKDYLKKVILATVSAAGLMSLALLAPNAIEALSKLGIIKKPRKSSFNRSIERLRGNGLLVFEKKNNGTFLRITSRGELTLERLCDNPRLIKKPKRWDGKWRMVMYDMKEPRKKLRDRLRTTLIGLGFVKLQNSVWVYPYDCEDLITLIKADSKIGEEVLYVIADTIENDKHLKEMFGLPLTRL